MPIGNGGIIGPNNTPSLSSAKGVWSIQEAMLAQRAGTWPLLTTPDPYFDYTTLLLPGNGTNGAQNNTFLDSSTNNFTITRNGNTTQGTFSPFSQTGWGNYFDGTGDFLQVADAAPMELGSGNWTIEMWVNTLNNTQYSALFTRDDGGTTAGSYVILLNTTSANGIVSFYSADVNSFTAAVLSSGSVSCRDGAWHHIAVVRNSNTLTMYIDGTATSTASFSGSFGNTAQPLKIGSETGYARDYTGYISNVRLVVGTAVYTSNFTPPTTPLTAISGTSLLTCQSNRFIDNSTNNFTITRNGDVSVQAFSPFNPTAAWSASTNGGSGYFDGSGDYLTAASNAAFGFGTGDFTVEAWVYIKTATSYANIIAGPSGGATWYMEYSSTRGFYFYDGTNALNGSSSVVTSTWKHLAVSRSGTTLRMFVDGVLTATHTTSSNIPQIAPAIGAYNDGTYLVNGYISNLRVVKGTAVYTAAFTPPTAPLTAITNTSLLLSTTNAGIYDATAKNDLETVGNAQISTTQSKFGGSSMAFDGSGDRLTIPFTNDFLELGINGQNFTVEAWIYPTNTMASAGQMLSKGGGAASWSTSNGAQYQWGILNSAAYWSWNSSGSALQITNGNVTLNAWQHLAVTYDGTTTRTFLNGVLQATSTSPYTAPTTRNVQYIGMTQSGGFTQEYYGYIQDLRITKGIARYTAAFTPPTAAFPLL
jgi:hypothetical protein